MDKHSLISCQQLDPCTEVASSQIERGDDWPFAFGASSTAHQGTPLSSDNDSDEDQLVSIDDDSNDDDTVEGLHEDEVVLASLSRLNHCRPEREEDNGDEFEADELDVVPPPRQINENCAEGRTHPPWPAYLHHRHQVPRQRPRPINEQQGRAVFVQFPHPAADNFNLILEGDELSAFLDAVYFVSVPISLYALPLATFLMTFFIISTEEAPKKWEELLFVLCGTATLFALKHFICRTDLLLTSRNGRLLQNDTLEKYVFKLLAVSVITALSSWTQGSKMFEPFIADKVLIDEAFSLCWKEWIFFILKCYLFSFMFLFLMDIPLMIYRMANNSTVFREILAFELVAFLLPAVYIVLPFLLMNLVAAWIIPPEKQSLLLWGFIHLVAFAWIALILVGMVWYPEITVQRRHGVSGYMYMSMVTLLQTLLTIVFFELVFIVRIAAVGLWTFLFIRRDGEKKSVWEGNYKDDITVYLYLKQIYDNTPPSMWRFHWPYPMTYWNFCTVTACLICQLRGVNFTLLMLDYDRKLEAGE